MFAYVGRNQNLKDLKVKDLMGPERKHGLSTEQFSVCAYVGSSKNLKDLKVKDPFNQAPIAVIAPHLDHIKPRKGGRGPPCCGARKRRPQFPEPCTVQAVPVSAYGGSSRNLKDLKE